MKRGTSLFPALVKFEVRLVYVGRLDARLVAWLLGCSASAWFSAGVW